MPIWWQRNNLMFLKLFYEILENYNLMFSSFFYWVLEKLQGKSFGCAIESKVVIIYYSNKVRLSEVGSHSLQVDSWLILSLTKSVTWAFVMCCSNESVVTKKVWGFNVNDKSFFVCSSWIISPLCHLAAEDRKLWVKFMCYTWGWKNGV